MSLLCKLLLSPFSTAKRRIPLQILSDLHLEVGQQYTLFNFPCAASHLVLAGDIGRLLSDYDAYLSFFSNRCCNRFDHVLLVLGNHEFYGGSHARVLDAASKLELEPILGGRLTILYRRRIDLSDNVTILGCTLHSHIPPGSSREVVQGKSKDFQRIDGWTVDDHNAEHDADVRWPMEEVEQIRRTERVVQGRRRRIIVITHYAPCMQGTSDPRHADNPWNSAFATDLLPTAGKTESKGQSPLLSDVQCWIFGHTHFTTDFKRNGIRLVSNQRGYVLLGEMSEEENEEKASKRRVTAASWKSTVKRLRRLPAVGHTDRFCLDKVVLV